MRSVFFENFLFGYVTGSSADLPLFAVSGYVLDLMLLQVNQDLSTGESHWIYLHKYTSTCLLIVRSSAIVKKIPKK